MNSNAASDPPSCPMCHQSAAVVPILYGLVRLEEAGKEAAKRGDFVVGGCSVESEGWCCRRCEHSFGDPQLAIPPAAAPKDENDTGSIDPKSRDGIPIRFMKKTFHQSGVTVMLTKADTGKGYLVVVNYPNGTRVIVEADSRARAKQIASVYRLGERPLVM